MNSPIDLIGIEKFRPDVWILVFQEKAQLWWLNWLPGRFKHVLALSYVPAADCWLMFDPGQFRASVLVVPNGQDEEFLQVVLADHQALRIRGSECYRRWRIGFNCTQAVAHIVGLSSCALHPDGLWRHCIANGAEIIDHGEPS